MTGILGLAGLLFAVLLVPRLRAEDDANAPPAARAVRLSFVEGEVHLYQGNQPLVDQALANTPLFEGARIETGNDGRAEIQFEDGSVARISPESSVTLSVLTGVSPSSERDAELLLDRGLSYFEIQGDTDSNHLRVRFGDTVLTTSGFTVVRVNVDKGPGEVAVFSGNVHMEGGASPALDLHGGESVALNANNPSSYNLAETIEPDSWDAWNSDRDQDLTTQAAGRTEATDDLPDNKNPAWNDLDANGNWYNVPDQGYVWSPNEASNPDWDPYGNGYWMNTPSYGYMWISGYPWGYLPYQCGAWNYYGSFGWGWAPGYCNPWWGGGSGWVIRIGHAPPRYHYPIRPRHWNPRPGDGHPGPKPIIPVHHPVPVTTPFPTRPRTTLIAGHAVQPLKPVEQPRLPYNHPVPVIGYHPAPPAPGNSRAAFPGNSSPRPIAVPARPGNVYMPPPQPRPGNVYTPTPQPRPYNPPPSSHPAPPPPIHSAPLPPAPHVSAPPPSAPHVSSAPPSAPHVSGGGGGGGAHPGAGPHR